MRVLIINSIPYTAETKNIRRAASIKDTMIYDLCLAFRSLGYEVTLMAAEPYQPEEESVYPFEMVWCKCVVQPLFMPHRFPVMPQVWEILRKKRQEFDLIISSEIFSASSLAACLLAPKKTVVWHELAKHNALLKKIPSRLWYNVVARLFMNKTKVVARSAEAREFIGRYCGNVLPMVIDHGVNLDKFKAVEKKKAYFIVCSQLIKRKRIDGILRYFAAYLTRYNGEGKLYIVGDGEERFVLETLCVELQIKDAVVFTGRLTHDEMVPLLAGAQGLLVNTEKDNSMISIVEAIAVGTPVITTDVPLNASYIRANELGIVGEWTENDLWELSVNNSTYVNNCLAYRDRISTEYKVKQFIEAAKNFS